MKFEETGLPFDEAVYRAFQFYAKNLGTLRPERRAVEIALPLAQLLDEKTGDRNLVTLALLSDASETAWRLVEKSFDKEVRGIKKEIDVQLNANFKNLRKASEGAKNFILAAEAFEMSAIAEAMIKEDESRDETAQDGNIRSPLSFTQSSLDRFEGIMKSVSGTVCPELEDIYMEALYNLRDVFERRPKTEKDAQAEMMEKLKEGELPPPSFEETKLLADDRVYAAYDIILRDPRSLPFDICKALDIGEILSLETENPDPDTVATALILFGVLDFDKNDLGNWKSQIGAAAADNLHSVLSRRARRSSTNIADLSESMRQVTVAYLIDSAENMLEDIRSVLNEIKKESIAEHLLREELMEMRRAAGQASDGLKASGKYLIGHSGSPRLEKLLLENFAGLEEFAKTGKLSQSEKKEHRPPSSGGGKFSL